MKVVQADKDGRYTMLLPSSEYTLVAEIGGQLYLNNQIEDGTWATTTVEPNGWPSYTIENVNPADQ